jgi:L-threonylcarbamoyladenylate synthase
MICIEKNHSVFLQEITALDFEHDIVSCLDTLRNGGIILYPTDTIWGIGCDATDAKAVQRIFDLKQRPPAKSMIVLLSDAREVNRHTSRPQPYIMEYLEKTISPTTVIYDGALGLAENLISGDGSIAMRIVQDDFCRHLIKRLRKPLVSTSANISGHITPQSFSHIKDEIIFGVDYVVKYRQTDERPATPSSVIQFNNLGEPVILRS